MKGDAVTSLNLINIHVYVVAKTALVQEVVLEGVEGCGRKLQKEAEQVTLARVCAGKEGGWVVEDLMVGGWLRI